MAVSSSRRPKLNIKEIEVECARPATRGSEPERLNLMLTIVRGPRGRRKLMGEAFTRQVYQPIIHFKVYHDNDRQELFRNFLKQLVHRGYRPLQYRELDLDDRWGNWEPCDLSHIRDDLAEMEDASKAPMDLTEI